jgi:serine/threonine protein kinase
VLGFRYTHSLGLLHSHLTKNNILFDSDHCIQIVDFQPVVLKIGGSERKAGTRLGVFSGEGWTAEKDIQLFASILFELLFGRPAEGETSIPMGIPNFVSTMIKSRLYPISGTDYSLNTILATLKSNMFEIEDGIDSAEV